MQDRNVAVGLDPDGEFAQLARWDAERAELEELGRRWDALSADDLDGRVAVISASVPLVESLGLGVPGTGYDNLVPFFGMEDSARDAAIREWLDPSGPTLVPVLGETTFPGQVPAKHLGRTAGERRGHGPHLSSSKHVPVLGGRRRVPTPARDRISGIPLRRHAFVKVSLLVARGCDSCGGEISARSVAWERRDWRGRRKHLPLVKCEACHSAQAERLFVPSKRTRVMAAITAFGATSSHIAAVTGIHERTVNRVLRELRRDGVVHRRGRSLHFRTPEEA